MWHAIYTKPGKEDAVSYYLRNIGLDVLNPKLKSKKYRRCGFIDVIEPLFPCYLFADFDKERYSHLIKYTRGVRYIVGKNNPVAVHDEGIGTIRGSMDTDNIVAIKPERFEKGDRVVVRDGPFGNFYGIFEKEVKGPERVVILLDAINYRLELERGLLIRA